jgi:hypothetical protein
MRRLSEWVILFALVCCLSSFAACDFAYPSVEGRFDRSLNVSGTVDLDVSTGSGSIDVRPGSSSVVQVHGVIRARDDMRSSGQDKIQYITQHPPIEQSGNMIRIGRMDNEAYRNNVSISYEILVPGETRIRANTGSGSEKIEGIRGSVNANTGSGSITLTDIAGDVQAHTGSGGIEIDQVSGRVEAETGSGSIRAENVAGSIKASTGSGRIRLGQNPAERGGAWDVEADTGSGSIEATGVEGSLHASTSSGGIRASGRPGEEWDLSTSSGSIHLQLDASAAFDLDAHASSGTIRVEQPVTVTGTISKRELRGKVGGGGPLVRVRTSSGGITIR